MRQAIVLSIVLVMAGHSAMAQTPTITMEPSYESGEWITFGYANAPPEQGLMIIVPKGTPTHVTKKSELRARYFKRSHHAPKRRGVAEGKERWQPLEDGDYELRIYDGNGALIGSQEFRVGSPISSANADTGNIQQAPSTPSPEESSTAAKSIHGTTITMKPRYRPGEWITFDYAKALPEQGLLIIAPKGTPTSMTQKSELRTKYFKRSHYAPKRRNVLAGSERWQPLKPGEYELRIYDGRNELIASQSFRIE